jgi:hypothetical protein
MGILMRCSSFRLLLVAVAAAFHTPPVGGTRQAVAAEVAPVDALPADTNQIKRLTPEQAKKLAAEFPGVEVVERVESMTSCTPGCLPLNGLKSLDAATARELVKFKGQNLYLNGLTTLDADTAKALAVRTVASLYLNGLTTLDVATAQALAGFKGGGLYLNGLTRLDVATAKALAERTGGALYLNGLATLDAATAKTLAALDKWDGDLSSIVAIESPDSVEIAAALATRKGPLRLPNLKKISPKTLAALIEKEDVMIPKGFETRGKARQQGR